MSDTTDTPNAPSPEDLALLCQVVQDVARARRMSPEDAEDFAQSVQVRMVERRYEVFRRFDGRSSLRTYLYVVVRRQLLDWQNGEYGRWRPSISAERLGPMAVELERLIHRDGHTAHEAIELTRRHSDAPSVAALQQLLDLLPPRQRRRKVSEEMLADSPGQDFDDPILAREARIAETRIKRTLTVAVAELPDDERQLLLLRYHQRHTVPALAVRFGIDQKQLYRRFDRVLRSLREALAQHGISDPRTIHPLPRG